MYKFTQYVYEYFVYVNKYSYRNLFIYLFSDENQESNEK